MRILLVGEYSRLHNSLKEGLLALNHEVLLISTGDFFKKYPSDILLKLNYHNGYTKNIKVGLYKLFKIDITSLSIKNQFFKHSNLLKDFDVVQLINESPFAIQPDYTKELVQFLKNYNKKLFLLCCGTDYMSVSHALSNAHSYSILSSYKNGSASKKSFQYILKYITPPYKSLHEFVYKQIDGVIASDMDYHIPLKEHPKYVGLIPNPVNLSKLGSSKISVEEPITIFMGINQTNYHTKGIVHFEGALKIIDEKYGDRVNIQIVENLPYDEYIKVYNEAHIVLDQVYAYDQGYNALEAMAKGKVVFTGAEKEFESYYKLEQPVAINALPDSSKIAETLTFLIENPKQIQEIGRRAKAFVLKEHDHEKVAQQYVDVWNSINKTS